MGRLSRMGDRAEQCSRKVKEQELSSLASSACAHLFSLSNHFLGTLYSFESQSLLLKTLSCLASRARAHLFAGNGKTGVLDAMASPLLVRMEPLNILSFQNFTHPRNLSCPN